MSHNNLTFKIPIIFSLISICIFKFCICKTNLTDKFLHNASLSPCIVGGYRPANQSLAKYVVSLRRKEETAKHFGYTHFCAGSIIARNKILTAAHCFYRKRKKVVPSRFKVVAKTPKRLDRDTKTQEINIKQVILHPNFKEATIFNDIAVLILDTDILLEPDSAAIIPLNPVIVKPGTLCHAIGWGKLYMNGPLANEILQVDLHVHSREHCRKLYPYFSSKKLCASNIDDKEKDACSGDSGGPMICGGVLAGIVSYGYGCGLGHAGFYTNVYKYLDWINRSGRNVLKPSFFFILSNLLFNAIF